MIFEKSGTCIIPTRSHHMRGSKWRNLPDRPPRSPAHHTEGRSHRVRLAGYRSRQLVSAALRLTGTRLHSAPLTDSPLLFVRLIELTKTQPFARTLASGLAVPARSSHHASHPVRHCVLSTCLTLGDSFARRTWGSDSPLESVSLPSHPVAALTRAAGPRYPPPVLCSLTGMDRHPPAHNPPGRTPPALEGTGSQA